MPPCSVHRPGIHIRIKLLMGLNILIAHASRRGATAEAAETVAAVLREQGMDVVVTPARKIRSVNGFDAVVLGTAIRAEKPLADAVRFVSRFNQTLSTVPTALFVLCLTLVRDTPENRDKVNGWIAGLVAGMRPVTVGLFAGAAEKDRMGFLLGRFMEKILANENIELGDYRDWDMIRQWAGALPEALETGS